MDAGLAELACALLQDDPAEEASLTEAQRSQLHLVAGRYPDASRSIHALMGALVENGEAARAQRWVPYLLFAQAETGPFSDAGASYAAAFRAWFATLDDLAAVQTHYWFVADLPSANGRLRQAIVAHAGQAAIARADALELIRQAAFVKTYRMAERFSPALIREDEDRRFLIDDKAMIAADGGVFLSAHVARPRRTSRAALPAAMVFTIYADPVQNRNEAVQAAARGYAGVVVDARGKRLGNGPIVPYEHDGEDANAAIDWISRQPWNDGRVVMYGGSYSGFAAWAAASYRHPALKAIAPYVAAIPGLGLPMENNIFLTANYAWPFYVASNRLLDKEIYGQRERWNALSDAWYESGRAFSEIDQVDGMPNPWLQRWLHHPDYDAYWQAMVPYGAQFAGITVPALSITGYYDDGQISALQYVKEHVRYLPAADHRLLIGPYDHFGAQAASKPMRLRGYTLDASAQFDTQALTFQWFDHVLAGAPLPALLSGRVNYQLMGTDQWWHADSLAEAGGDQVALHLSHDGEGDRYPLTRQAPRRAGYLRQTVDLSDRTAPVHSYYPWPIVQDDAPAESGLSFVSAQFEQATDIVGSFSGDLKIRINKRDVDLGISLYEVMRDGRRMQLSYYIGRASYAQDMTKRRLLTPGKWTRLSFDRTRMTGRRMAAGSRLLVVVDVLRGPGQQVNYGTGRDVSNESVADAGEPLRIDWHSDSVIRVPLRVAAGPSSASESSPR
ncbi:CocE/NonD family hydrolase [Stenotrophomonas sp. PUT21]|jgi:putative CocE/NonD family hydrolase|uniref:CocE/NonD family hydrolase n=1 Tax=Stenotrophomonas TaxID=40323 RepID=UPI003B7AED1A